VAKIDLASPELQFVVTPRGDVGGKFETACATTLEFARQTGVDMAINASPFGPFREHSGEGMDIVGLAVCDGDAYSPAYEGFGALVFDRKGRARIIEPPVTPDKVRDVDDGLGGFRVLVKDGKSLAGEVSNKVSAKFAGMNPRTAVGLSADGKTMWWIVADGRQEGRSEGLTLTELARFGISLGSDRLLNLDGGGSTTLVLRDPEGGEWRVVNCPVGRGKPDTLRLVGNNLGVVVRSSKEKATGSGP
jgi:exopolysaccharide biosynthesis protein